MLREVGKIFARAFRMIFQYPIFIYLPAAYYSYKLTLYFAKNIVPLELLSVWKWVDFILDTLFQFGTPIVFVLIVLRSNEEIDLKAAITSAREFFWRYVGQSFVGIFLSFLFILPLSCLVLTVSSMEGFSFIASSLWLLIFSFVSIGPITLGLRFLLDSGNRLFKNAMDGFRMLNGYLLFFITLYGIETLIWLLNYSLRIFIGSIFTGLDLSSLSFSSLPAFTKSVSAFYETPAVYVVDIIIGTFAFSFYNIAATLAYVRCKNHASLSRAVSQPVPAKG